jgi:N-acetylglucosamine-6-sulfatase
LTVRPNVLLIVTDDQRSESLSVMRALSSKIDDRGIRFEPAVVAVPICGPNRVSLLTGQYAHSHGCYANPQTAKDFAPTDGQQIGGWLRHSGYRTGLFGKYLNGYRALPASYVPPGWHAWEAIHGNGGYYDYDLQHNDYDGGRVGVVVHHGSDADDYFVDVVTDKASTFIRSAPASMPVFAYVAYNAPHAPFIPARRHKGSLASTDPWRPPSYNEDDVSDKPAWLRDRAKWDASTRARHDEERIAQLETLLSVDEGIAALIQTLRDVGRLADTLIVYTSDNGFLWGEHRRWGKGVPYRAAHEVPLLMRWDGRIAPGRVTVPVSTIDISATLLDVSGATPTRVQDGRSLVPFFANPSAAGSRDHVFFEKQTGGGVTGFCAQRSETHLFTRYATGEEELYNYAKDPHELENRTNDPASEDVVKTLRNRTKDWCEPEPPGMGPWGVV